MVSAAMSSPHFNHQHTQQHTKPSQQSLIQALDGYLNAILKNRRTVHEPSDPQKNQCGPVVDLRASGTKTYVVGDIHANLENLDKILSNSKMLKELQEGKANLVFLGDIIHPQEGDMSQMDTSLAALAKVAELKARFPSNVHIITGNHDFLNQTFSKGGISQSKIFREALSQYGQKALHLYDQIIQNNPLAVITDHATFAHAGPIVNNVPGGDLKNIQVSDTPLRSESAKVTDPQWQATFRRPGQSDSSNHGYQDHDVDRFLSNIYGENIDDKLLICGHTTPTNGFFDKDLSDTSKLRLLDSSRTQEGSSGYIQLEENGKIIQHNFSKIKSAPVNLDQDTPLNNESIQSGDFWDKLKKSLGGLLGNVNYGVDRILDQSRNPNQQTSEQTNTHVAASPLQIAQNAGSNRTCHMMTPNMPYGCIYNMLAEFSNHSSEYGIKSALENKYLPSEIISNFINVDSNGNYFFSESLPQFFDFLKLSLRDSRFSSAQSDFNKLSINAFHEASSFLRSKGGY